MHLLLVIAILAAGMVAASPPADACRKYTRGAKLQCYARYPPRAWRVPPQRRAWRYNSYDPAGEFRGFPGWARKAFTNLRN
jgi:hypothetical protein